MSKSTIKEPSVEVSTEDLLDEDMAHLIRAALADREKSHKQFCEEHGLNRSIFSRILNRKQVPTPPYAEAISHLLEAYIPKIRFKLERVEDAEAAAKA